MKAVPSSFRFPRLRSSASDHQIDEKIAQFAVRFGSLADIPAALEFDDSARTFGPGHKPRWSWTALPPTRLDSRQYHPSLQQIAKDRKSPTNPDRCTNQLHPLSILGQY